MIQWMMLESNWTLGSWGNKFPKVQPNSTYMFSQSHDWEADACITELLCAMTTTTTIILTHACVQVNCAYLFEEWRHLWEGTQFNQIQEVEVLQSLWTLAPGQLGVKSLFELLNVWTPAGLTPGWSCCKSYT